MQEREFFAGADRMKIYPRVDVNRCRWLSAGAGTSTADSIFASDEELPIGIAKEAKKFLVLIGAHHRDLVRLGVGD